MIFGAISNSQIQSVGAGLTNGTAQMVQNANQINLMIWAIVVILLISSTAIIFITRFFIVNYRDLTKESTTNLAEFRKSVDNISDVLRGLSEKIAVDANSEISVMSKLEVISAKLEVNKKDQSDLISSLFAAFREHESNASQRYNAIDHQLTILTGQIKNLKTWCEAFNTGERLKGDENE